MEIRTDRLILRQWRDGDRDFFANMNRDADVMRFFPRFYTRAESDAFVDNNMERIDSDGWGNWAVEVADSGVFIGFTGFSCPAAWHPCAGEIEIGWRLRSEFWGQGFATEAARGALNLGFDSHNFDGIVSFTSVCNLPSIAVMKKLSMKNDLIGFEHPRIDVADRLCKHVVYRLSKEHWSRT